MTHEQQRLIDRINRWKAIMKGRQRSVETYNNLGLDTYYWQRKVEHAKDKLQELLFEAYNKGIDVTIFFEHETQKEAICVPA